MSIGRVRSSEFKTIYTQGKRYTTGSFTCYMLAGTERGAAFVASSAAVGNAILRNRARRLMREAFRLLEKEKGPIKGKIIFKAGPNIRGKQLQDVYAALLQIAGRFERS